MLFTPLRRLLNVAECFFFFLADTSCLSGEKYDFLPVRLLLLGAAACVSRSTDIGTSCDLPASVAVRFAKIRLKESVFHARHEKSLLTLNTSLHCEDPMFCGEINYSTGTLFKEFRSNRRWSVDLVKIDWIIASIIRQIFLFGYLANVDRSFNGHLLSATHYGAFLRPYTCEGCLARFIAFSATALKRDWVPRLMHTLTAFFPTEWAFVSRLYLEEFRRELREQIL